MIAHKFLRAGRIGPFSEFRWPEPGVWVKAEPPTDECRTGIHACRVEDLPWWLADELWQVELDGEPRIGQHKLIASAGRLRRRIEAWTPACAQAYGEACAWRARDHAIEALARAHHDAEVAELEACGTLEQVLAVARRLAETLPDARISLTIAGDGVLRAISGPPPTCAYIAAHAALRLDGPAGYAAERAWQSDWLKTRLALDLPERP
jgi:hypothetical protein